MNTVARRPFFRRRKACPFAAKDAPKIDYKDIKLLQLSLFPSADGTFVDNRMCAF